MYLLCRLSEALYKLAPILVTTKAPPLYSLGLPPILYRRTFTQSFLNTLETTLEFSSLRG